MNSKTLESVSNTLAELLDSLQFPYSKIEVLEESDNVVRANVETEKTSFLIGVHGERINALQHVLKNILWKKDIEENIFVIVDTDGYKKSREEKIIGIATEKAEAVRNTGISQTMPPLAPYLRKLVHTHFSTEEYSDITTESIGEGTCKRMQILVTEE
jgi:spoIIIJ-associated protein